MTPTPWLTTDCNLPVDRPFTRAEALRAGVARPQLREWELAGLLVRPLRGVYHASQLVDGLELRLQCLRLVVPEDCVVTDRTAAWLLGAPMALAPGDHLVVPAVSMFRPPGYRLRNDLTSSGERCLAPSDVLEIDGLRVTTPLRTACDLGRLLHRDQAFAAMDCLLRLGSFTVSDLVGEFDRFKGYRGILQARLLAPLADARSQSPGESILRLRWLDCGDLPPPTPQLPVPNPKGGFYHVDLGVEELRYAAEYDGEEWHGEEQRTHDESRRGWMTAAQGYVVDVFRAHNIHGHSQNAEAMLQAGVRRARLRGQS